MKNIHLFDNGVMVYDAHLLESQRQRYAKRNVHEEDEENIFLKIIGELPLGAHFANIGTAIGYYPILAKKTRKDLHVSCFEPLPRHLEYFRENIRLNGMSEDDFLIRELAVSATSGRVAFRDASYGSSLAGEDIAFSVKKFARGLLDKIKGKTGHSPCFYVNSISLVELFSILRCKTLEFVQMDIQGFEQPVLEKYFSHRDSDSTQIQTFLIGTHGIEIHSACVTLFRQNGYTIVVDNHDTKNQPDGIIHAQLDQPNVE